MSRYENMSASELKSELSAVNAKLAGLSAKGLKLDLTRGKPGAEQLALSADMLTVLSSLDDCVCENGTDCFISWDEPTTLKCPECGGILYKKRRFRGKGPLEHVCLNEDCGFHEAVNQKK